MNIFLANVGNRDIALDIGDLFLTFSKGDDGASLARKFKCQVGTRNLALYVQKNINKYRDALRLPILGPALQAALEHARRIDLLVLFATDQPLSAEPHREWDTIESAELINLLLPDLFRDQVGSVVIERVEFNPSEHDRAYNFIGSVLDKKIPREADIVFASIKGGIPAMNAALRERVVQRFGQRALLVETDEPPEGERWQGQEGKARILSSWPFRRDMILRLLEHMLNRYDYSGALRLLELEGIQASDAKVFLQHALARLNLDFKGAAAHLEGMIGTPHQWRILAEDAWGLQRLADLACTAQTALEREDYAGFLSRTATFCENCRRLLCWVLTDVKAESGGISFSKVAGTDSALADHLASRELLRFNEKPARPVWRADRNFFSAAIEWGVNNKHPSEKSIVDKVRRDLGRLSGLEQLRHDVEHQMQGVSHDDIETKFSGALHDFAPLTEEILKTIASVQRIAAGINPPAIRRIYDEINETVRNAVLQWSPTLALE